MASKQQAADQELDPKYEWQENAANFVLRVHLSGFRKEDFRVQVDGAGRLTVRGQRADGGKHARFHKVFQLPPTSNLDDISGRFDAGVLALTVPKRPAPPATIDDLIRKHPTKAEEEKEEPQKAEQHQHKEEMMKKKKHKEEEEEKKAEVEAKKRSRAEQTDAEQIKEANKKSKAEQEKKTAPLRKAEGPTETKAVHRESILEEAQRQTKPSACGGWKEELTKSDWAEGVVETVKKNKEVIAAAVAAFSLGLFVSSRLFSRN